MSGYGNSMSWTPYFMLLILQLLCRREEGMGWKWGEFSFFSFFFLSCPVGPVFIVNCKSKIKRPWSNDLLIASYSGLLSILVLLDRSTAFDTVSHDILLDRQGYIGIADIPLAWLKSYLTDHTQFVQLKNLRSSSSPVSSCVPQGSS